MKKVKFYIGMVPYFKWNHFRGGSKLYWLPCLYSHIGLAPNEKYNSITLEIQWFFWGLGIKYTWKNKKYIEGTLYEF